MKRLAGLTTLIALPMLFAACRDGPLPTETQTPDPAPAPAVLAEPTSLTLDGQSCEDLVADQTVVMGEVCVINDVTQLLVRYETHGGWTLYKTHLAVAGSLEDIPQTKKGNPLPGRFPDQAQHDAATTSFLYSVPLAEIGVQPGDEVVIAAHATVVDPVGEQEGAWCGSEDFEGKNWARFTHYSLAEDIQAVRYIGPEGGTISAAGGEVLLAVPATALASVTAITIRAGEAPTPSVRTVGPVWEFGPAGTVFDPPAELTIPYDPGAVPVEVTDPTEELTVAREQGGLWMEISSTVDAASNQVTALIPGFSRYGPFLRVRFVELSPPSITLVVGEQIRFSASTLDVLRTLIGGRVLGWGTRDAGVATVDQTGLVTATAEGSTQIGAASIVFPCNVLPFASCVWTPWPPANVVIGLADVTVVPPDPVADAGPDQTVTDTDNSGSEDVTLDGSGSTDPDNNIATYEWFEGSITGTPIATGVSPTVALAVGVHTLTLLVTDADALTDTDDAVVDVEASGPPPPVIQEPIFFASPRDGDMEIFSIRADGSNLRQLTHNTMQTPGTGFDGWPAVSRDGSRIAYQSIFYVPAPPYRQSDIIVSNADGSNPISRTTLASTASLPGRHPGRGSPFADSRRAAPTSTYTS